MARLVVSTCRLSRSNFARPGSPDPGQRRGFGNPLRAILDPLKLKLLYPVIAVFLIVYLLPSLVSAFYVNLGNRALIHRILVESASAYSSGYRSALDSFHRALSWNPRNTQVYWAVGLVYERAGDEARAREAWTRVQDDQRLLTLADGYCRQGDCERALDLYELVLTSWPGSIEVHCRIGDAYRRLGDLDRALMAYRKGVEVPSASSGGATAPVSCHLGMGKVYVQKRDWRAAIYQFERVLRVSRFYHPEDLYQAYLGLGKVYRAQGRYSKAVEAFQRAIAVRPRDRRAYVELGRLYLTERRVDDAVREYLTAIELDPEKAWLHIELGDVYRAHGAVQQAAAAYQRALELEPDNAEVKGRLEELAGGR